MYTRVQRIWLFFRKMKNTDPLMGAKLKSKTHLLNKFFWFFEPFFASLALNFEKVLIWPLKKFIWKNQKRCLKTQNFTLISNPLKKLLTNAQKKVTSKTSLTNVSKSEKSAYFRHVFANNFFWCIFANLFQRKFCVFWYPYWIFVKKIFFALFSTFFRLLLQMRRKRLKKRKIVFYECVLEFNYATIKGFA